MLLITNKGVFPAPAKTAANIVFWLSKDADVKVKIFTVSGEIVIEQGGIAGTAGYNDFYWDLYNRNKRQAASGVYLYRITAKSGFESGFIVGKIPVLR
jgi:flagellar hook assembly protein FlgD